jgi:UDP-2-acetamido-3-amino-2,3-dideoxy-glucuronate N-acetyltransferase
MSILLAGCGYWGQNWAKTLAALNELGCICEPNPSLQAMLAEKYPGVRIEADLQSALRIPEIEAVVIATPVVTHKEVAAQCLREGKHVLVEKPLTLKAGDADELVRLADGLSRRLAVGHLLMYHPVLLQLKTLIGQGALGEVRAVQCTRVNLGKIRNEENAWWSLAPHDLSIISFLLDEPLRTVRAFKLNPLRRSAIEDTVYASFQTPSGKEASVHVSWLSPYKKHETLVVGTKAIAVFDDTLLPEQKLALLPYNLDQTGDTVRSICKTDAVPVLYEPGPDLLTREAEAFLQLIRGERHSIPNDGRNGLQVVQLLEEVQALLNQQSKVLAPV